MTNQEVSKTKKFYNNIKESFNKAAQNYDANAVLQNEIGQRLIDRLDFFTINPQIVLDLGMGTGYTTNKLAQKYSKSQIIGMDIAENMLQVAKNQNLTSSTNILLLQSDINKLPVADNSVDLIFSNFTFQWCENITNLFTECLRILKVGGLIFFSIPGPDTLFELRAAFNKIDPEHQHVNNFIDMHNIGDILVQTKFGHPVMDNEYFTLTYSKINTILKDIKSIGANTKLTDNYRKSLFSKTKYQLLANEYENFKQPDDKLPLTYEVIYGHAFKTAKPVKVKYPEISEVMVPIEKIIKK